MRNCFRAIFISFLFHSQCIFAETSKETKEYLCLDKIAVENDTSKTSGKGSNWHNYTKIYAQYFGPLKNLPLKFLEIGIFEGNGVKLWETYFKKAELHFMDISFDRVKYFSERSFYHLADQENPKDLLSVMQKTGGNFDIILDDGGHTMKQQLISFQTLFPYVKSGGLYIIEDLHTSYWKSYGGDGTLAEPKAGSKTFIQFLKNLIDDVNFVGANTSSANHDNISETIEKGLTIYQKDIYSMHFYDSLCIIIKR